MVVKELFKRFPGNPILTAKDFPDHWSVNSVLNSGVGDRDGKTLLFVRAEDRQGISVLVGFCSEDGITGWVIDESTVFKGDEEIEGFGVEDPRLTWIDSLKRWAIVYTHHTTGGPLVSIATTANFRKFRILGNVLPPENKDAALFPEPINGYWRLIHRPVSGKKQIWIAKSKCCGTDDDFSYWGDHNVLLSTDGTPRWDGTQIGLGASPMKTKYGWLIIYHGTRKTASGILYRLGLAMLSLNDPSRLTHRTREFIMSPLGKDDFMGDVGGVIFPCGWRVHDDGKIRLYYGAADSVICYADAPFDEVVARVLKDPI